MCIEQKAFTIEPFTCNVSKPTVYYFFIYLSLVYHLTYFLRPFSHLLYVFGEKKTITNSNLINIYIVYFESVSPVTNDTSFEACFNLVVQACYFNFIYSYSVTIRNLIDNTS